MIVLIAGAPGSGKTTLANHIKSSLGPRSNVDILDLDDVNRAFVEFHALLPLLRREPARFAALYQLHIDALVAEARRSRRSIVFVGIPAALLGTWPGQDTFLPIDVHADERYAIDIPVEQNARQWIQRDMPELVDELAGRLKADVATYTEYERDERAFIDRYIDEFRQLLTDFRPSQRRGDIEQFREYFRSQSFTLLPPALIFERVSRSLRQ